MEGKSAVVWVVLSREEHKRLKIAAAQTGRYIRGYVRESIMDAVARDEVFQAQTVARAEATKGGKE